MRKLTYALVCLLLGGFSFDAFSRAPKTKSPFAGANDELKAALKKRYDHIEASAKKEEEEKKSAKAAPKESPTPQSKWRTDKQGKIMTLKGGIKVPTAVKDLPKKGSFPKKMCIWYIQEKIKNFEGTLKEKGASSQDISTLRKQFGPQIYPSALRKKKKWKKKGWIFFNQCKKSVKGVQPALDQLLEAWEKKTKETPTQEAPAKGEGEEEVSKNESAEATITRLENENKDLKAKLEAIEAKHELITEKHDTVLENHRDLKAESDAFKKKVKALVCNAASLEV